MLNTYKYSQQLSCLSISLAHRRKGDVMKKNNIWLLLDSSKSGGIESHVLQLAEGLHQHGEVVEVVFLSDYGKHPLRDLLLQKGIPSRTLNGSFKHLYQTLKVKQPSVVHTHGYKAGIFGRLAAWLNKLPTISTYHAGEVSSGKLALYDWLDRISAGFASKVFAVSPQIAARLPGQAEVFNNFVNCTELSDSTGEQIAFVGRVSREKGPDYFMDLAIHFPALTFHLYGDGPQLHELKETAPKNLTLHGQQDDMAMVWPNIGLLVMPSRFEGLPMAALEAMARGIPVIAFNVGALHRLIETKCNGWLIEPGNIEQLSTSIEQWCHLDKPQKVAFQIACKQTIKAKFSSDIAIPKLIANYQQLSS